MGGLTAKWSTTKDVCSLGMQPHALSTECLWAAVNWPEMTNNSVWNPCWNYDTRHCHLLAQRAQLGGIIQVVACKCSGSLGLFRWARFIMGDGRNGQQKPPRRCDHLVNWAFAFHHMCWWKSTRRSVECKLRSNATALLPSTIAVQRYLLVDHDELSSCHQQVPHNACYGHMTSFQEFLSWRPAVCLRSHEELPPSRSTHLLPW